MTTVEPDTLEIRLTGRVAVVDSSGTVTRVGGRQAQILLAMLVIEGGSVSIERVAEVLWGDELSDHWRGALRGVVSKLRNALAPLTSTEDPLPSAHGLVRLDVPITDNISRVEALTVGNDEILDDATTDELRDLITELRHPFLIHNESVWADAQRRRIEALLDHADLVVLDALVASGRGLEAAGWAEKVAARDPVDIRTRETLIRLHLEAGDVRAARRAYDDLAHVLATEYRREPDPELSRQLRSPGRHRLNLVGLPTISHHPHADEPFIGRETVLETLASVWDRVRRDNRTELVVIRGPAGIGKTRLADHAVADFAPPQLLWGRARPAGGHTWGPFVDALATVFAEHASLAHLASVEFPAIGRLLPDLDPDRSGNLADDASRDTALTVARQIVQDIVAEPTVMVIDDLQWIGADGLTLLETILTGTDGPLLVIATTRDVPETVASVLAGLARRITVTDVTLDMFDLDELARLVRDQLGGRTFTGEDIARLHHRTGGLPYFACALVREVEAGGPLPTHDPVPDSVSVWLANYLRSLNVETRRMLEVVAVFGTDADLEAVEAVVGGGPIGVADTIDRLAASGLVTIDRLGRIRIPHDLTARAVSAAMGPARRAVLHRLAGDHLATRGAPAATVAEHWTMAGPSRRSEALSAHLRAGSGSLDQGAWRAALGHFDAVQVQAADPETQLEALIGSGRAMIHLREHDRARKTLEQAIDLAAHHGNDHAMAEATLLLVGRAGRGAIIDDEPAQLDRLRAAYAHLQSREETDDDPRTQILLAKIEQELAISLLFVESQVERRRLLTSALNRIRQTPDATPTDLAYVLLAQRWARTGADDFAADVEEVIALPRAQLDVATLSAAHLYRHENHLRSGRRSEALDDLVTARDLAEISHHSYWRWAITTWEALSLLLDGELDRAEVAFAAAVAGRSDVGEAVACHQVNLVTLRLMQDRGAELLDPLRAAVAAYPGIPTWRAALALAAAESGDLELASEMLQHFVDADFENLHDDTNRFFALGILGHVAVTTRSRGAARRLYDLLTPYRDNLVLLNVYGGGGAYWGPIEWALARLGGLLDRPVDDVLRDWDTAVDRVKVTPVLVARISREAECAELSLTDSDGDRTGRSESKG